MGMTLEDARRDGQIEALRNAVRLLVVALSATENGPEIISVIRKTAFDAVDGASHLGVGDLTVASFEQSERETLAFIFSEP
jgi:hypothetical protein